MKKQIALIGGAIRMLVYFECTVCGKKEKSSNTVRFDTGECCSLKEFVDVIENTTSKVSNNAMPIGWSGYYPDILCCSNCGKKRKKEFEMVKIENRFEELYKKNKGVISQMFMKPTIQKMKAYEMTIDNEERVVCEYDVEDPLEEWCIGERYFVRLSADGFLDCTEWECVEDETDLESWFDSFVCQD